VLSSHNLAPCKMNNKFFGDKNDFFKYDLLVELMENSRFLKQLTFIPMLTRVDNRTGGGLTRYTCGNRHADLYEFLRACLDSGRRDICHLKDYFAEKAFAYTPFRDSICFTNKTRDEYFHAIPDTALDNALIFVDPDNGLTDSVKQADDKHLTYAELDGLYKRVKDPSIVVAYHHLARVPREELFRGINKHLQQFQPKPNTAIVSDNRIAFLLLAKKSGIGRHTESILRNYVSIHRLKPGVWLPRNTKC
jgi:hypothetical protein